MFTRLYYFRKSGRDELILFMKKPKKKKNSRKSPKRMKKLKDEQKICPFKHLYQARFYNIFCFLFFVRRFVFHLFKCYCFPLSASNSTNWNLEAVFGFSHFFRSSFNCESHFGRKCSLYQRKQIFII